MTRNGDFFDALFEYDLFRTDLSANLNLELVGAFSENETFEKCKTLSQKIIVSSRTRKALINKT